MKLFEVTIPKYKIYVDLDGVLADFYKHLNGLLDHKYDQARYDRDPKYKKELWDFVGKYHDAGGELWYELEPMSDAKVLWNFVKKYPHEILTATGKPIYKAGEQKKRWVPENIDKHVKINLVRKAEDKQKFAAPNHILIDDSERAIGPWKKAGGIGILHTSAKRTIAELKKLGL